MAFDQDRFSVFFRVVPWLNLSYLSVPTCSVGFRGHELSFSKAFTLPCDLFRLPLQCGFELLDFGLDESVFRSLQGKKLACQSRLAGDTRGGQLVQVPVLSATLEEIPGFDPALVDEGVDAVVGHAKRNAHAFRQITLRQLGFVLEELQKFELDFVAVWHCEIWSRPFVYKAGDAGPRVDNREARIDPGQGFWADPRIHADAEMPSDFGLTGLQARYRQSGLSR